MSDTSGTAAQAQDGWGDWIAPTAASAGLVGVAAAAVVHALGDDGAAGDGSGGDDGAGADVLVAGDPPSSDDESWQEEHERVQDELAEQAEWDVINGTSGLANSWTTQGMYDAWGAAMTSGTD